MSCTLPSPPAVHYTYHSFTGLLLFVLTGFAATPLTGATAEVDTSPGGKLLVSGTLTVGSLLVRIRRTMTMMRTTAIRTTKMIPMTSRAPERLILLCFTRSRGFSSGSMSWKKRSKHVLGNIGI